MVNQLEHLTNRVQLQKTLYIDIYDMTNPKTAISEKALNHDEIVEEYGSLMDYLKHIHLTTGVTEVGVRVKQKTGKSFIKREIPITVSFQQKKEEAQTKNTDKLPSDKVTFLGAGMSKSLELDEYLQLKQNEVDLRRITKERNHFEAKAKSEKRKRKEIQIQLDSASEKSFLDKPSGKLLMENAKPILEGLNGLIKGAGGLGGASKTEDKQVIEVDVTNNLSTAKVDFVEKVLKSAEFTDQVAQDSVVMNYLFATHPDFKEHVLELVNRYS